MRRLVVTALLAVGMVLSALPAFAEITYDEVEAARAELNDLSRELEDRVTEYERAVVEEALLRDRLDAMAVAVAARERELVLARRAARDRAADMYMSAGSEGAAAFASDDELSSAPARYVYLDSVSETDLEVVTRLEAARRDFLQQQALLGEAVVEQESLQAEMDALLEDIYGQLDAANAEYQTIKAEWEEQERVRVEQEIFLATSTTTTTTTRPRVTTTVPRATTTTTTQAPTTTTGGGTGTTTTTTVPPAPLPSGTMVCPVDGAVTFRDSWGEPRSGGRTHKGVDMMASTGTPLVAIESGYIYRISSHSAGGLGIYVAGESGALWYYAHNSAIAEGIIQGSPVVAGQLIAYVGYSGNASANWPHVHFAWIPNADWVYQNPFPIVDGLCR